MEKLFEIVIAPILVSVGSAYFISILTKSKNVEDKENINHINANISSKKTDQVSTPSPKIQPEHKEILHGTREKQGVYSKFQWWTTSVFWITAILVLIGYYAISAYVNAMHWNF